MHELYRMASEYALEGWGIYELFTELSSLHISEHTVSGPLMSHEAVYLGSL